MTRLSYARAQGISFQILGEHGMSTDIIIGRLGPQSSSPEWLFYPHDQVDGIGALAKAAGTVGASFAMPVLQGSREVPSRIRRLLYLLRFVFSPNVKAGAWKSSSVADKQMVWKLFSTEQTAQIIQRARERNITVNTALLAALSEAVVDFVDADRPHVWQVLVNMRVKDRSSSESEDETANHVGYISVETKNKTPEQIQEQVKSLISKNSHWALWQIGTLPRYIGKRGARFIMNYMLKHQIRFTGAFSNLGSYNSTQDDGTAWVFVPPLSNVNPLSAGAVTWNGRLGLCLHIDPRYGGPTRSILFRWVEILTASELLSEDS